MVGFVYPNRAEVTIIISKNAGRYRIQSTQYEALLFISHQIILRISEYYQFSCSFFIEDDLNLEAFYSTIENNFKLNYLKKEKEIELEKYTSLYTQVQKSLLNKYKV
jgi:Bardet-Biedl syndrome 9 protein